MPQPNDPTTAGGTDVLEKVDESLSVDNPWQVMLWNDPVNTTAYVTLTLMRVLEITEDAAERLMLLAHTDGKTAVAQGSKDKALAVASALQSAGLWATMEKVS